MKIFSTTLILLVISISIIAQDFEIEGDLRGAGFGLPNQYLSKPTISEDRSLILFMVSGDKGNDVPQINIAEKGNDNNWHVLSSVFPADENYYYIIAGAGLEKGSFFIYSMPIVKGKGIASLNAYTFSENNWTMGRSIKFPEFFPESSSIDVFLTPDENTLFISIYGEKSIGKEDVFVSFKGSDGVWNEWINVGEKINTLSSEISPYYSESLKTLFFASNKDGQFDLYASCRLDNSWVNWSEPHNLGTDFNTSQNDTHLSLSRTSLFLLSNRTNEFNEIYFTDGFSVKSTCEQAKLSSTGVNLDVESRLLKLEQMMADIQNQNDSLQLLLNDLSKNKTTVIEPIVVVGEYFSFEPNSVTLNDLAYLELDKVILFMKNNPESKLTILGYSDGQGSNKYNDLLAEQRAQSVYDYLIRNGIEESRLTQIVKGKSDPIAINFDAKGNLVRKGMAYNRRVELVFENYNSQQINFVKRIVPVEYKIK